MFKLSDISLVELTKPKKTTLLDSITKQLHINKCQLYYPSYYKFLDDDDAKSKLSNHIFDSKYKCLEILGRIQEDDELTLNTNTNTDDDDHNQEILKGPPTHEFKKDLEDAGIETDDIDIDDEDVLTGIYTVIAKIQKKAHNSKSGGSIPAKEYNTKLIIKKSPLLEPLKIVSDFYSINTSPQNLPDIAARNTTNKLNSYNNSAHVESLFCYLGNKLVEMGKCPTFPYYYGCINGIDPDYHTDITEEYEDLELHNKKWFLDKINGNDVDLIIIDNDYSNSDIIKKHPEINNAMEGGGVRNNRVVSNMFDELSIEDLELDDDTTTDTPPQQQQSPPPPQPQQQQTEFETLDDMDDISLTDIDNELEEQKHNKLYFLRIPNMPVSLVIMEALQNTIDNCINDGYEFTTEEWFGVLFQVSFGLAVAQKYYKFVHNDLHTSNIMFQHTPAKYLYYQIHGIYYAIPTFNKVAKIIDFARATFCMEGHWIFSDCFHPEGEASGQYDYPSGNKLHDCVHKPNPSFDLIRLSTTIMPHIEECPEVIKFFEEITENEDNVKMCYEDDDFDLYINIARTCHKAVPIDVLKLPYFKQFIIPKENIPKGKYVYIY